MGNGIHKVQLLGFRLNNSLVDTIFKELRMKAYFYCHLWCVS